MNTPLRDDPPFVLVDGSYFMFRAYHALPPLQTSQGLHTHAVRGAAMALQKLIRRTQPTHMAVVFDTPEPTFRHELSEFYKAHRPSMPGELSEQVPYLHALIRALGIPMLKLPGAEADDLIGTLARRACREGHHVLISTGDKDMCQLVDDWIVLEDSFKEKTMDHAAVVEKFGVRPDQIVDFLALMGDSSDGIPGIPRIGAKTAAKLLNQYDTMAGILAHLDEIKGAVGQSLRDHQGDIPLNHQLATIVCDLPLTLDWHELRLGQPNVPELRRLYTELEFRTLLQSLDHPNNPDNLAHQDQTRPRPPVTATAAPEAHSPVRPERPAQGLWHTILSEDRFAVLLSQLQAALDQGRPVVLDTETTALDWRQARLVGLSFAFQSGEACYLPLAHDYLDAPEQLPLQRCLDRLQPFFEHPQLKKIGHHLKYDAHVLANHGITLQGWYFDTMLASYVLNPTATRHNMDDLAQFYLDYRTTTFEDVAGKGVKQLTFNQVAVEIASDYAAEDADITHRLYDCFKARLAEVPALESLLHQVEMPLARQLWQMERDGILLDVTFLKQLGHRFGQDMQALEQQAHQHAGQPFNVASPKQLGEILFDRLGVQGGKKTASGQYATSEAVLEQIDHPLASTVLEYRSLAKLKNTYTDRLVEQADPRTLRVHTSYHQAAVATGRLSSSDPNLQNIPIRGETGRLLRQAFIAPPGRLLLAADYSQIELRLMAHFSQDEALLRAFAQGLDIHRATAAEVLGIALEDVTSDQRRQAKAINFGLIYGMSAFGLAKQLKISRTEAQDYIGRYFARYPGVLAYMERTRAQAAAQGYVSTLLGRRLYMPDIRAKNPSLKSAAERAAINAPLQGTAADIIKLAMLAVSAELPADRARMLLQVHDELVFEVDAGAAPALSQQIARQMGGVMSLDVPLLVEVGLGANWAEAHG